LGGVVVVVVVVVDLGLVLDGGEVAETGVLVVLLG